MKKILFITPPNINYSDFVNPSRNVKAVSRKSGEFGAVITDMPLGVLSLSAYVKKYSLVQTKLIDFNIVLNKQSFSSNKLENFAFPSFAEFFQNYLSLSEYKEYNPEIIGISVLFTPAYQNMLEIAKCCREIFPKALIVAGGGVPTNMYKEIYRDSTSFDGLCYGEGEKPLLNLIKAVDNLRYLEKNPSWITRKKVKSRQPFQYDFIDDLDEIPFFDYDILEIDKYRLNPTISAYLSIDSKKENFPVMTSRGCVFHCCFCAAYTVRGRKMRYYSVNRVKKDFRRLRDKYGVKTIIFQDDHFMADPPRVLKIIEILRQFHLTAFFPNSLALYALDRKILEALKSVGVNQLVLSIESGSNRVLSEIMHKPLNLSIAKRVADDCRELGIYTDVNILIGLPGETKRDIEDTRKFLKTLNANWFRINVATPLVGSEMYDICLKKHYLKGNYLESGFKKAIVETEDFTTKYIQEKTYRLNLEINFVNNSDFRLGNFKMALQGFENALRAKNDHAFAYYYGAKCCQKIGDKKKARRYMKKTKEIVKNNPFWRKYASLFKVAV